jgi:hypothetical protein
MAYDQMGNYSDYEDYTVAPVEPGYETEEERKKRLEKEAKRADESVAHEQKVITYENGSKTVETKQEVPAGGAIDPAAYNASIARQESGARPDIGYHDPAKSSAFGTYGMTSAGYADARKVNPNLPADITQATPEQQTSAQNAYTQQNAKYLQNYGVEPTANNLQAAHFLGAKGLSDYLKTGYISPQAARANGGEENVKRIVNQRLGGQPAAASGAAVEPVIPEAPAAPAQVTPEAQPARPRAPVAPGRVDYSLGKPSMAAPTSTSAFIEQYQTAQNDPKVLMKMGTDENVPEQLRDRARNRAADIITQQREQAKAETELGTKSPSDLARMMTDRKKDGNWGKYVLFGLLGMHTLRDEEAGKLGIGTDRLVTGADGKGYLIKTGPDGRPIEGFDATTGKALTSEELIRAAAGAGQGKTSTSAELLQDKAGNLYRTQSDEKGRLVTRNAVTNEIYKGDEKLTRARDVAGTAAAEQKQGFRRENATAQFALTIRTLDYGSKIKAVEEAQKAAVNRGEPTFTDAELSELGVNPPDLGRARARTTAAPAARVSTPVPVVPQGPAARAQPIAPVVPGAAAAARPVTAAPVAPGKRMTVDEMKQLEKEAEIDRAGRKEAAVTAARVEGGIAGKELTNIAHAKEVYDLIMPIQTALKDATGSGLGTKVDAISSFFGGSTKGAEASAQLKVLGSKILMNVPRFEGPQSDKDTAAYKEAAGSLADSTVPIKQRSAALKTIIDLNKKYAPELDWSFTKPQTREQVIGGITYIYDGKGWRAK